MHHACLMEWTLRAPTVDRIEGSVCMVGSRAWALW